MADPELDVQIMQFDMNGNQIEGGLLDSRHPRTEWKNPVRTSPYFSAWRDQVSIGSDCTCLAEEAGVLAGNRVTVRLILGT